METVGQLPVSNQGKEGFDSEKEVTLHWAICHNNHDDTLLTSI